MEDLQNAMRVIDDNSDKLPEGDYLKLCNYLKNVYKQEAKKDINTLVDYDTFNINVPGQDDQVLDYFYDHYYQMSLDNDRLLLSSQKEVFGEVNLKFIDLLRASQSMLSLMLFVIIVC